MTWKFTYDVKSRLSYVVVDLASASSRWSFMNRKENAKTSIAGRTLPFVAHTVLRRVKP